MARRPKHNPDGLIFSHMADVRADYDAAKHRSNRFLRNRTIPTMGASADYHIRSQAQFIAMMELAREFERNEPLLRQGIRRLINNVNVGAMGLDPDTGDKQTDRHLVERWEAWSSERLKCHTAGKMNWPQLCNIGLARTVIDGDFFGLPTDDGTLQTHEAHRCRTPNRSKVNRGVCGVLNNDKGRPVRYYFTKAQLDPYKQVKVSDIKPIDAVDKEDDPQVFHVFKPERYSQSRGITSIAPIVNIVGMRDDLEFAMLVKAQVSCAYTIMKERELGAPPPGDNSEMGEITEDTWTDNSDRSTVGLHPGMVVGGEPGVHYTGFTPNVPNAEFFEHSRLLLTYMAINLDLPLIVLLLDARDANFSSYRNVIDQARMSYHEIQKWFASQFHAEVYRWKVRNWMRNDPELQAFLRKTEDPLAIFRHGWNPVGYPYIQPVHDTTANLMALANGMTSLRRFYAGRGTQWEKVAREIVEDRAYGIALAIEQATDLNRDFAEQLGDERIHWRDLMPTPTADGITLTFGNEAPADSERPQNATS